MHDEVLRPSDLGSVGSMTQWVNEVNKHVGEILY